MIYSILQWLATLFLYLSTVWYSDNMVVHILAIVPLILISFYEVVVFARAPLSYIRSIDKLFTVLPILLSFVQIIVFNIVEVSEHQEEHRVMLA